MSYFDCYKYANYLKYDLGIKKGYRVAILMPNLLEYSIAIFGILLAVGGVNLNQMVKTPCLKLELKENFFP